MATRAQALIPITIAAAIVGIVGLAAVPDDVKLESVDFPRGTIALDGKFLEVQIADDNPRRTQVIRTYTADGQECRGET